MSDAELVARVAAGDERGLAELYDRYADALFVVAFRRLGDRESAQEVVQETYLTLWNRAELFDARLGSLLAWLSTIARNRAIDRLRALRRRPAPAVLGLPGPDEPGEVRVSERIVADALLAPRGPSPDPQQVVDEAWVRSVVRAALDVLPEVERRVLELAYYEGSSQSEIAHRLGWPIGTVKTRTRRALSRLRAVLGATLAPELGIPFAPTAAAPAAEAGAAPSSPASSERVREEQLPEGAFDGPR